MRKILILIIFTFIFSTVIPAQTIIDNPEKPLSKNAGRIVHLVEVMRITDEHEGYYFKFPHNLKISPDDGMFVEDEEQLLKFDKNGKFIRNFFKKGQGADELLLITNYIFQDNSVVIHDWRLDKILILDQQGNQKKTVKLRVGGQKDFFMIYDNKYYFFKSEPPDTRGEPQIIEINTNLAAISPDGETMEKKYGFPLKYLVMKTGERVYTAPRSGLLTCVRDNETLYISHTNEYEIKLFSLEKNRVVLKFKRKYKTVKVTDETKKYAWGGTSGWVSIGGSWFEVPVAKYHDDIQKLLMVKDRLWAFTSTVNKEKGILVDVFDKNGRYIDNFYLRYPENVIPYRARYWVNAISDSFIYAVEQDEEENYAIVKYRIEDKD